MHRSLQVGSGDGCGKECGKDKAELRGPGVILEMMVGSGGRESDNGTAHLLGRKWRWMTHTVGGGGGKEQVSDRALLTGVRREEVTVSFGLWPEDSQDAGRGAGLSVEQGRSRLEGQTGKGARTDTVKPIWDLLEATNWQPAG